MPSHISSPNNPQIKDVIKLDKRAEREERHLTVVEGTREVSRALANGVAPVAAYVCPERLADSAQALLRELERRCPVHTVTPAVYARLAVREESGGLVIVIPYLDTRLDRIHLPDKAFVVVVENAEKPGNLGAILRTADAAGVHAVIACGGTDLHNPNVVRASLGTLFTVQVAAAAAEEAVAWLQARHLRILAATPAGAQQYTAPDYRRSVAIVLGSEAHGLSETWLAAADQRITIPMFGQADSLNLAASTAILLYEVVRQRAQQK
jgi:TrmH family RNA methyltransferase